jgi:hypothetical protein
MNNGDPVGPVRKPRYVRAALIAAGGWTVLVVCMIWWWKVWRWWCPVFAIPVGVTVGYLSAWWERKSNK